jgi:hypothetical protein
MYKLGFWGLNHIIHWSCSNILMHNAVKNFSRHVRQKEKVDPHTVLVVGVRVLGGVEWSAAHVVGGKECSDCIVFLVEVVWCLFISMVYLDIDMNVNVHKASVLLKSTLCLVWFVLFGYWWLLAFWCVQKDIYLYGRHPVVLSLCGTIIWLSTQQSPNK